MHVRLSLLLRGLRDAGSLAPALPAFRLQNAFIVFKINGMKFTFNSSLRDVKSEAAAHGEAEHRR